MTNKRIDEFGVNSEAEEPPCWHILVTATEGFQRNPVFMYTVSLEGVTADVNEVVMQCTREELRNEYVCTCILPVMWNLLQFFLSNQRMFKVVKKAKEFLVIFHLVFASMVNWIVVITLASNDDLCDILELLHDLSNRQYKSLGIQLGLHQPILLTKSKKSAKLARRILKRLFPSMAGSKGSSCRDRRTNLEWVD